MSQRVNVGSTSILTKDGTMIEVPFPDKDSENKILLSRIAGQFRATSSKCTHYGAPLAKGVITQQGQVVCPWHGAKFSCVTGDIEDAPGLNSLQVFKVEVEGDQIYVHADEKAVANSREPAPCKVASAADGGDKGVVIIGGGAGAAHAVEGLREEGYKGKIRVVSAEPYLPIDRTKLSKALITDPSKIAIRGKEFYDKLGVEFLLGTEADKIDFEKNEVHIKGGGKTLQYEQLIVATGATPNRIPVDGADLDNVFVMRNIADAEAIDKAIGSQDGPKKNVVVIGSSFIGMEVAFAAASRANVSVVGMEKAPFEAILGAEIGNGIRKAHEEKGTKFYLPASLDHFEPSESSPNAVGSVVLKDGQKLPADVVVLGVGVKPATSVLKNSGVPLEKDQSVKTDEFLRIGHAGAQGNVFAIGDIANYKDIKSGENVRVEHWNVAGNHARAVAMTIMQKGQAFEKISVFWSAQKAQLRYAGTSRAKTWKDVIVQGNPDELKFVAYYLAGDNVVAVASMGNDPIAAHCSELMRLDKMLSAADVRAGKSPFDIPLAG